MKQKQLQTFFIIFNFEAMTVTGGNEERQQLRSITQDIKHYSHDPVHIFVSYLSNGCKGEKAYLTRQHL